MNTYSSITYADRRVNTYSNNQATNFNKLFCFKQEKEYDEITALAKQLSQCPISLITFITEKKQIFKSRNGIDIAETPISYSLCKEVIKSGKEITLKLDKVTEKLYNEVENGITITKFKYYSGFPIYGESGEVLASLCVIAFKIIELSPEQKKGLRQLANQAGRLLKLHKTSCQLQERIEELRIKKLQLDHVIEHSKIGIWQFNLKKRSIKVEPLWLRLIGQNTSKPYTIAPRKWFNLIHPEDRKDFVQKIKECINNSPHKLNTKYRMRHKKGNWKWMHCKGSFVKASGSSSPSIFMGTHTDITSLIEVNHELLNRNTFIETIIENSPIGIATYCTSSGKTFFMNPRLTADTGWKISDIPNKEIFYTKVFPNIKYRKKMKNQFLSDIMSGNKENMYWENIKMTCKNGDQKIFNIKHIPIPEQNLMISYANDITEKYNYIRDIEWKNQKFQHIAWVQSHEVRAPLARIMGIVDMIQEFTNNLDPELEFLLKETLNSANELDSIIKKITSLTVTKDYENYQY